MKVRPLLALTFVFLYQFNEFFETGSSEKSEQCDGGFGTVYLRIS
jgi:hypothetical protein